MQIKNILTLLISLPLSATAIAQDLTHNRVQQVQQNIQNSIKGTLHGVMRIQMPMPMSRGNQLIFPHGVDNGFSNNPWLKNQKKPQQRKQQNVTGFPKGNPWAPVGAMQNIPLDRTAVIEKNPYTDAPMPNQSQNVFSAQAQAAPYNSYNNSMTNSPFNVGFNNGNNSFPTPFGNQFWPTNQFWPGGTNGNSSMPFMPW